MFITAIVLTVFGKAHSATDTSCHPFAAHSVKLTKI